jgi:hypothetical protein
MSSEQKSNADWNSITGKPQPKHASTDGVDPHHAAAKHDEPLGRVEIAPAKPVWPSKECLRFSF